MKLFIIAAAAAASMVGSVAFANVASASTFTLCAEEARNGWKLEGGSATFTDWSANQAIGEMIGDGNCQSGWTLVTDIDPRIDGVAPASRTRNSSNSFVTNVTTVTNDAGRITASWQGFAPEVLLGRSVANGGDGTKWKLVDTDGVNHTYKLKRVGIHPWPRGSLWVATDQDIIDRDFKGGTAVVDRLREDKLRYAASTDTTTTDTQTNSYVTVTTFTIHCPSVYDYTWLSPEGEAVAFVAGEVRECNVKRNSRTVQVGSSTSSVSVTGDRYVTPQ